MSMTFILIQIKFNMDKNNDELFKNIQKCKKKKNMIITSSAYQCGAQIIIVSNLSW
jgi:hypothetical protein